MKKQEEYYLFKVENCTYCIYTQKNGILDKYVP